MHLESLSKGGNVLFEKEYALLRLFEVTGCIEGRKKLQKTVHLLQSKGVPFDMKFKYYHYGPYSTDLQSQINMLVAYGLIDESNHHGDMYIYEITEKGKEFIAKYRKEISSEFFLPVGLVKHLLSTCATTLELSSTYSYLIEMGYDAESAHERTTELKPHLKNHLSDAIDLYNSLNC